MNCLKQCLCFLITKRFEFSFSLSIIWHLVCSMAEFIAISSEIHLHLRYLSRISRMWPYTKSNYVIFLLVSDIADQCSSSALSHKCPLSHGSGNWLLCSNYSECGVTVGIFLVHIFLPRRKRGIRYSLSRVHLWPPHVDPHVDLRMYMYMWYIGTRFHFSNSMSYTYMHYILTYTLHT